MKFEADWDKRINETEAREIVKSATILGYSDSQKDCYWTCYQLNKKYYIGLNDDYNIWEVNKSDIDDYNHNPVGQK
jgi:hypothetical protein